MSDYIIGDSWSSGTNSETGRDHDGYGERLGIPVECNLAIAGSTAYDWTTKYLGRIEAIPEGSVIILSLGGNDIMNALGDGKIDSLELMKITSSMSRVMEVELLKRKPLKVVVITYQNPYVDRIDVDAILGIYRMYLTVMIDKMRVSGMVCIVPEYVLDRSCFSRGDFHPNNEGYRRIAEAVKGVV